MKKNKEKNINVLMCCSDLSVKGGMVSVLKNYLEYKNWENINIKFIPTHIEKSKLLKAVMFSKAIIKIILLAIFKKIDIAHLHVSERGSVYRKLIISKICKLNNIKVVLHHHGAEFEDFYLRLNDKEKEKVNTLLNEVDLNIVLSEGLVENITQKAPMAKVKVLYNSVITYNNNPYNNNAKNVLFLGRLGVRKGIYDLIEAIKILDSRIDKEIKFYLCGDGEIEEVREKINNYGLESRIAHLGWIDRKNSKELLDNICINVLPSYNEGLPMTILETMAYGIPNISTNIASIPEVIEDGVNGYLINPGNIDDLIIRIEELLKNKKNREKFSEKSYELIKDKFSLNKNIDNLKGIWREILL